MTWEGASHSVSHARVDRRTTEWRRREREGEEERERGGREEREREREGGEEGEEDMCEWWLV